LSEPGRALLLVLVGVLAKVVADEAASDEEPARE
jgi:hypothetical protein